MTRYGRYECCIRVSFFEKTKDVVGLGINRIRNEIRSSTFVDKKGCFVTGNFRII